MRVQVPLFVASLDENPVGRQAHNLKVEGAWSYNDVQAVDVKNHPRLERMKEQVVIEMLSAGDRAGPSYYTAQPIGRPFRNRVAAATPILDTFMRVASQLSRKNAHRALKGRRTIFK